MNWLKCNVENLSKLRIGEVCWVYSSHTKSCSAAVYRPHADFTGPWACHGQEHFSVSGVTKFIVLPT